MLACCIPSIFPPGRSQGRVVYQIASGEIRAVNPKTLIREILRHSGLTWACSSQTAMHRPHDMPSLRRPNALEASPNRIRRLTRTVDSTFGSSFGLFHLLRLLTRSDCTTSHIRHIYQNDGFRRSYTLFRMEPE
jgi:hypothetical protein